MPTRSQRVYSTHVFCTRRTAPNARPSQPRRERGNQVDIPPAIPIPARPTPGRQRTIHPNPDAVRAHVRAIPPQGPRSEGIRAELPAVGARRRAVRGAGRGGGRGRRGLGLLRERDVGPDGGRGGARGGGVLAGEGGGEVAEGGQGGGGAGCGCWCCCGDVSGGGEVRGAGGVVGGGRGIGVRVEVGPRTGLGGGESRDDVRPVGGEDVLMLVIGRGRRREGWEGREGLRAGGRGGLVVQTAAGGKS